MSQKISTKIPFQKFHGAGNDFVLVQESDLVGINPSEFAVQSCDRNYGIGADGLIIVAASTRADIKMIFFNPDGTRDVCGNGMRCVALHQYLRKPFHTMSLEIDEDTLDIEALYEGSAFRVLMHLRGNPINQEIESPNGLLRGMLINPGTPHFVIEYPDLESLPIHSLGAYLEHHKDFAEAVSVDFVRVLDRNSVEIRIWERSVGETLACGTAACAVALALMHQGQGTSPLRVISKGGELIVESNERGQFLTGPARYVYHGSIRIRES